MEVLAGVGPGGGMTRGSVSVVVAVAGEVEISVVGDGGVEADIHERGVIKLGDGYFRDHLLRTNLSPSVRHP
jgi:hypothetical protein